MVKIFYTLKEVNPRYDICFMPFMTLIYVHEEVQGGLCTNCWQASCIADAM
jgi:hypothetical protein